MRYIVTVAALILSYGTTASYAQRAYVYDPGDHSCGKYLAAVHDHPPGTGMGFNDPQRGHSMMTTIFTWLGWADFLLRPTCGC